MKEKNILKLVKESQEYLKNLNFIEANDKADDEIEEYFSKKRVIVKKLNMK